MKKIFIFIICIACPFFIMAQNDSARIELIDEIVTIDNPIGTPLFDSCESFSFKRNDTIFCLNFYPSKTRIDSVAFCGFSTRLAKQKWISISYSSRNYGILKYKKVKTSKWFRENNGKYFHADYECEVVRYRYYYADGSIRKYWKFGNFSHISENHPKKK